MADKGVVDDPKKADDWTLIDGLQRTTCYIIAVLMSALGEEMVDHFVTTRLWEWRQFGNAVTDWELRRYFEII